MRAHFLRYTSIVKSPTLNDFVRAKEIIEHLL